MNNEMFVNLDLGIRPQQRYLSYGVNSTFNYANNSLFYAFVDYNYRTYYFRSVKENLEWYDGYVNNLHNVQNGIFSTQLANALCNNITKTIFGKKLMYKNTRKTNDNKALDFITNVWSVDICDFNSICKLATEYSGASGTSLLKINQSYNDFWVEPLRQDQFYFKTDFRGRVIEVECFIKSYIDTTSKDVNYMLVEKRYLKECDEPQAIEMLDGTKRVYQHKILKPAVEYCVFRYTGQIQSNLNYNNKNVEKGLNWFDLPKSFRRMLKKDYTAIKINEPIILPFSDNCPLGCELIRVNGFDGQVPYAQFGKSWLSDIRADLIEYELMHAYSIRDMWNGQGQVGVPKRLSQGDLNGKNDDVFSNNTLNYETFIGDPTSQKPIITQFDLRVDEWTHKKDDILKKISTKIGMSPKIIASYLADAEIRKTATQVFSDDDSIISFVEEKRGSIEPSFNKILSEICMLYGFTEKVAVRFGLSSKANYSELLQNVDFEYQNGYIGLRQALAKLNPDASESQLDELEKNAVERQKEIELINAGDINDQGEFY